MSDVLIGISHVSGANIIAFPELERTRIFITVKEISLPGFFDILSELGISKKWKEGMLVFFSDEKAKRKKDEVIKIFSPLYISPQDVVDVFRKLGLRAFSFGKHIVAKGKEDLVAQAQDILKGLDKPPKQIKIEAKILELSEEGAREIRSFLKALRNNVRISVNVGEPVIRNVENMKGGVISIDSNVVDYIFSYLVRRGKARVLSSPNILTIEGRKAKIVQGISIPYEASTQFTVETRFVDALLELEATPYVSGDKILMRLKVSRNFPTFEVKSFRGVPAISKNELNSEIIVGEKKSVLVGGIIIETSSEVKEGVPLLSSIPVIGFLFSYNAMQKERREIIVSIRPEIISGIR